MRSDKDSELETYGEGIKKEIQYRRTLYLSDQLFPTSTLLQGYIKDTEIFQGQRQILTQPEDTEFAITEALADFFFSVGGL